MNMLAKGFIALSLLSLSAAGVSAQVIVRIRPPRPAVVVARPMAPSPRHVWVDEDWVEERGNYRWHGGYWAEPPRQAAVWVPGHWAGRRRGYAWIPGHWR